MQRGSDGEKLAVLLRHWMEHNAGHAREFGEWAKRAGELGKPSVGAEIERAAEQVERANEFLVAALEKLEE